MLSSVGLEVMNSSNLELNWKPVMKGRRTRKATARSLNSVSKVGYSTSPKKVGDLSGFDFDKFDEAVPGQSTSRKSGNVPIKKRRHLPKTPSLHTWTPSLCPEDSASPTFLSSSSFSEDHGQLPYPSSSSGQRSSNWKLRGTDSSKVGFGKRLDDIFLFERTEQEYNDAGDFSGIELLAAAASMDDADNANTEDSVVGFSLVPKNSDEKSSATQCKQSLKINESENSLGSVTVNGGNSDCSLALNNSSTMSHSPYGSPVVSMPKMNRQHWDLNAPMDAWDKPYDDSVSGNTLKDVNDDVHGKEFSIDSLLSYPAGAGDGSSGFKVVENKLATVSADKTCHELPTLEGQLPEPPNSSCMDVVREASDQATEKDAGEANPYQVLSIARDGTLNQAMNADAIRDVCPSTELCMSSSMPLPEDKINTIAGTVGMIHDEDCSSTVGESEKTTTSDGIQTVTQDIIAHNMPTHEMSETAIDVQCRDINDYCSIIQDGQSVLTADSRIQRGGISVPGSAIASCQGHVEPAELVYKHGGNNITNEGAKRTTYEDLCKSSSGGAQCDEPTFSIGKVGSAVDAGCDFDVCQENHFHLVDGDDLTRYQDECDYEDGELRCSLYSWEGNDLENEYIDYESDGRNGDGSDAADNQGSVIVEGGSDGSSGTQRRSSLAKRFSEGNGSNSRRVEHSLRRRFVNDHNDNNEMAVKGSNAGSGTTVEQSTEMNSEENDDDVKRGQSTDQRGSNDVKMAKMGEYASKAAGGKLQSRIEGQSSFLITDGKDAFSMPQPRSRRFRVSHFRPERGISPDKHLGRYRPSAHSKRDGVHHWTWGSRRQLGYHGANSCGRTRPRSIAGDSDKIGGLDFHDPRQTTNYLLKDMHRPLIRSPAERDDYVSARRRMPLTRGVTHCRSRGHYSQCASRDFGEDCEHIPDDTRVPVRLTRFLSRKERSFSPNSGRSACAPLPRRRSRSRSRTRSPRMWHSHREQILSARRHSRSPYFRSEARMERLRAPFPKSFASDYRDGYVSPSRGRFSPMQHSCRWVDDHSFENGHSRHRRSPVRVFRRTQRIDAVGSGPLKSDEYFRPMIPPRRFSFMTNGGKECKLASNYDYRRRDDSGEMMQRVQHPDDSGNVSRFRRHMEDNFEKSNLNDGADVRLTDPRDAPQAQGENERGLKKD